MRHLAILTAVLFVTGLCAWYACGARRNAAQTSNTQAANRALFESDPQHISNRLYRGLYVRSTKSGDEYGFGDLDPLLWLDTNYLLTGPSHVEALRLLDEFSRAHAEEQIPDSVRRAVLQRDLWAVFDWAAPTPNNETHRERLEISTRLALTLRNLALTRKELSALPNPYIIAIRNKEYPAEYDPAAPDRAFLPPDLFDPTGSWVCIGAPSDEPTARMHEEYFSRSVFFVFIRLPGGREATLAYLKRLADMRAPLFLTKKAQGHGSSEWNPEVPQFPVGAELALVRQLVLPDSQGNLVLTPIVESVQIRHYQKIPQDFSNADALLHSQAVVEISLDRAELFSGGHSGLRAVRPEDRAFPILMVQEDAFEEEGLADHIGRELPSRTLSTCTMECHGRPGAQSMMTLSFREKSLNPRLAETTSAREVAKVLAWKQTQVNWNLLVQLWKSNQPSR
jgi:hypothetical protein